MQQRVRDATIYPTKAPNGSTILIYGHETGVGIAWRGGRPLKKAQAAPAQSAKPAKVNGTSNDAIMIIDSDDDEPAKAESQPVAEAEFEADDEELDPDQPYPSIIQHLRLALNTEVLHVAVPQIPTVSPLRPAESIPAIFSTKMVFAVTCADCTVRVITLPLSPPTDAAKEKPQGAKSQIGEEVLKVLGHQSIPRGITVSWTSRNASSSEGRFEDDMDVDEEQATTARQTRAQSNRSQSRSRNEEAFDLLVASHSAELGGLLKIWRFQLAEASVAVTHPIVPQKTVTLRKPASRVVFNTASYPKRRHSQLLITDSTGTARVYDIFATNSHKRRANRDPSELGGFVRIFRSSFESVKHQASAPTALAARKAIIDASWLSDGRYVMALLADGEWGIWDIERTGPSPPADQSAFSLRGYVWSSEKDGGAGGASSPKRGSRSSLAPMTPNTRRRKEDSLFQGSPSISAITPRGGISVASLYSANGSETEDSAIIWYGREIYRIADVSKFWARTASASSGNSLPSPSISQIQDISLLGEVITSISQFDTTSQASRMAVPRDILISAEHRLIINTNTAQSLGRDFSSMFAQEQAEHDEAMRSDQALLSHGELDLGGMDRLLEGMDNSGAMSKSLTLGNPRKVLFASSAA